MKGEFRAIVFTQRRNHAVVLKEVLERCSELEWIKPAWLVGHGGLRGSKGVGQDGGMKSKAVSLPVTLRLSCSPVSKSSKLLY